MIDKIIKDMEVIGRHRYNSLTKALRELDHDSVEELVAFRKLHKISVSKAEKKVKDFEEKNNRSMSKEQAKRINDYLLNVRNYKKKEIKEIEIDRGLIYRSFISTYKKQNNDYYDLSGDYLENLKPVFHYFVNEKKEFESCKNVVSSIFGGELNVNVKNKGILLVGNFGVGKTSIMRSFEEVLRITKKRFKTFGSKEAVNNFQRLKNSPKEQNEYFKRLTSGIVLLDDILKESKASSYGMIDLIGDVIEVRERTKKITHYTINYDKNHPNDIEKAIEQIGQKYGGYILDRVLNQVNIIAFKGVSKRK